MKRKGLDLGFKVMIHETYDDQHRICICNPDGTNQVGEWVPLRQVAHLEGYFAITGESPLPQGVFTCKQVAHQVLG